MGEFNFFSLSSHLSCTGRDARKQNVEGYVLPSLLGWKQPFPCANPFQGMSRMTLLLPLHLLCPIRTSFSQLCAIEKTSFKALKTWDNSTYFLIEAWRGDFYISFEAGELSWEIFHYTVRKRSWRGNFEERKIVTSHPCSCCISRPDKTMC